MSKANDKKILELKKQIQEKKNNLAKIRQFKPVTNCLIHINESSINIHTLDKTSLISLLVSLNSNRLSAIDLKLEDDYFLSGFPINAWITDIKARLDILNIKQEEKKLQDMEDKLHLLLSSDKKTELEIDKIEEMLKSN